ncbi:MAG: hypothetical protein WCG09_06955 [Halobacteriota archaeon]|jgi:hypothetical protein
MDNEHGPDDHRSLVQTREQGRCLRTKREPTAKTNDTNWYSLTAREPIVGTYTFLTKYQGASRPPVDGDTICYSDGGLAEVAHYYSVFLWPHP